MGKPITFQWAINHGIAEEMRRDPTVFIVGEDVGKPGGPFGVTRGLIDELGAERAVDTPISEGAIIGLCIGAAAAGLRPVAEIMFMNFSTLCVEEFYNQASKMRWMFGGPPDLTLLAGRKGGTFDQDEVRRIVDGRNPVKGHGGADMPIWGDVFKRAEEGYSEKKELERIEEVVSFLAQVQRKP